jgi:heme/copper-type cytochrome/quinol oxidase subunit 1
MAPSAKWFGLTASVLVLLAFLSKLWEARSGFDLQIHDTYFVISPAPVSLAMAFFLAVCSAAYYFIPMNPRAIGLHFWVTSVGLTLFWTSFYLWGYLGVRSAYPTAALSFGLAFIASALIVLVSPAVFAMNLLLAISRCHRLAR